MKSTKDKIRFTLLALLLSATPVTALDTEQKYDYPGAGEIILTATFMFAAGAIDLWGHKKNVIPDEPTDSLDYRINNHYGLRSRPVAVTGDLVYWGAIAGPAALYGFKTLLGPANLRPLHLRMGLTWFQGFSVTYLTTQVFKVSVRRHRPDGEDTGSFFSGHASLSFYSAAFMSGYLGDLIGGKTSNLRGGFFISRILPSLVLYSAAGFCAWSRIRNHKHYFTDVLAGSMAGLLIGNLTYYFVFPRQRREAGLSILPIVHPSANGVAVMMTF